MADLQPPYEDGPEGGDGAEGQYNEEGEEGEEDIDEEDPEQLILDFASNEKMDRIQLALYKQLMQTYERVKGDLAEKDSQLAALRNQREGVGVELYSMQQQLARLQMNLEQTHAKFNGLQDDRVQAEESLEKAKQEYNDRKEHLSEHEKQLIKNQQELNGVNETIHQVEKYNEEMQSEIAVTRRAAYKAEEAVTDMEKAKKGQDLYIDSLTEQLKAAEDQIALYEQQLAAQRTETAQADQMLRETAAEMELIAFEKKQLLQQWQSSLLGLARRDEALTAAGKALREAQAAARDHELEAEGTKRECARAIAANEGLEGLRQRLENEAKFAEEQGAKLAAEREQLAERYAMLQRSMTQTDEEERKVELVAGQLRQQVDTLQQNLQTVTRERQKLEEGIEANKSTQTTVSKAVKNLQKQAGEVLTVIHEKEIEGGHYQNEMARIKVDALNTEAHNVQLRDTLGKLLDELKAKDALIEKYQMEIRQRNDEIEKKMYRVDRLNRKYEKLTENIDDVENMGPLESTIRHLQKEIESVGNEVDQMQHEWLADQTTLVHTVAETEELLEKNAELKAKVSILSQKRLRQLQEIQQHKDDVKRLSASIEVMHKDMVRLNELIGQNAKAQGELQNQNFVLEKEFVEELRELEGESLRLEARVQEVRTRKAEVLEEIVETERQVMLWEKKIQLERETQAALDPEVGMSEAKGMEKEIHRMKLRLENLKREQERLLAAMETAVLKREQISVRFQGKKKAARGKMTKDQHTKASLKKKIVHLKREVKATATETANFQAAVAERKQQIRAMTADLEAAAARYGHLEERAHALQAEVNGRLYEKQRAVEATNLAQRAVRRFQELEAGAARAPDEGDSLQVENGLLAAESQLAGVRDIIEHLQGKFDHLDEVLERVMQLTHISAETTAALPAGGN